MKGMAKMDKREKRNKLNGFSCTMPAKSVNEGLARGMVSALVAQMDPTIEEICDIKTAVSEAVTNCIVHAYKGETDEKKKKIGIKCEYYDDGLLCITVKDSGCGIEDIEMAMQPMYSGSGSEERSGMGFSIMQCFTDRISVRSKVGKGTTVVMKKYIGKNE